MWRRGAFPRAFYSSSIDWFPAHGMKSENEHQTSTAVPVYVKFKDDLKGVELTRYNNFLEQNYFWIRTLPPLQANPQSISGLFHWQLWRCRERKHKHSLTAPSACRSRACWMTPAESCRRRLQWFALTQNPPPTPLDRFTLTLRAKTAPDGARYVTWNTKNKCNWSKKFAFARNQWLTPGPWPFNLGALQKKR